MSGLVCIFAFGMLFLINRRKKAKKWWLVAAFAVLGGCALANTILGTWVAQGIGWLCAIPAGWFATGASLVAAVFMLLLIFAVCYDIGIDHKADKVALAGLIVLPLLFIVASGPVAGGGNRLAYAFTNFGAHGLGYLVMG
jgi:hypothetical protein